MQRLRSILSAVAVALLLAVPAVATGPANPGLGNDVTFAQTLEAASIAVGNSTVLAAGSNTNGVIIHSIDLLTPASGEICLTVAPNSTNLICSSTTGAAGNATIADLMQGSSYLHIQGPIFLRAGKGIFYTNTTAGAKYSLAVTIL